MTRSIGVDGAVSDFCDFSGRGLTTPQIERTLRVFTTAIAIDLSNNEMEHLPQTIPAGIQALDASFNLLANANGIQRLEHLRELHLGFNRLQDASILEYCTSLKRVNLSGNRLTCVNGLETLDRLEYLDISDNLIEEAEDIRMLSLNQNLTHLTLRGNPFSNRPEYRAVLLELLPNLLVLDERKVRSAVRCRSNDGAGSKSLSYARIYDDKKHFHLQKQARPQSAPRAYLDDQAGKQNSGALRSPRSYSVSPPQSPPEQAPSPIPIRKQHTPDTSTYAPSPVQRQSLFGRLLQKRDSLLVNEVEQSTAQQLSPTIKSRRQSIKKESSEPNSPLRDRNSISKSHHSTGDIHTGKHVRPNYDPPPRPVTHTLRPRSSKGIMENKISSQSKPGPRSKNREVLSVVQMLIERKKQSIEMLSRPTRDSVSVS